MSTDNEHNTIDMQNPNNHIGHDIAEGTSSILAYAYLHHTGAFSFLADSLHQYGGKIISTMATVFTAIAISAGSRISLKLIDRIFKDKHKNND